MFAFLCLGGYIKKFWTSEHVAEIVLADSTVRLVTGLLKLSISFQEHY